MDIRGNAAILMNADTGTVLFEKNAYSLQYPASTTKVATALLTLILKGDALDQEITISKEALITISEKKKKEHSYTLPAYWLEYDGKNMVLKVGEKLSLYHLLGGMLIASGNDASNAIADYLGPTIPQFMAALNSYLKSIGCHHTYFCNPHGLHHPAHQTTAYDLAIMTKEALKYPMFQELVSKTTFKIPITNKQEAKTLIQTNKLLKKGPFFYKKAIGVKTGSHSKAKKTFIGAAKQEERTLIAVLLGYDTSSQIFEDTIALFEAAFAEKKIRTTYLKKGLQNFYRNIPSVGPLGTYIKEDLQLEYFPSENPLPTAKLKWLALNLPIPAHTVVGHIELLSSDQKTLKTLPLYSLQEVKLPWVLNMILNSITFAKNAPLSFILYNLFFIIFLTFLVSYFKQRIPVD